MIGVTTGLIFMKLFHQISFNSSRAFKTELAAMGFDVDVAADGVEVLRVDEADPRWPALEAWANRHNATHYVGAEFDQGEIERAKWVQLRPAWHHGYPQPESAFGYRAVTYDLCDYCEACGTGLRQKAPFRMRAEPKWGKRGVMQLNWVFDEFFVRPDIYETLFEPLGVGSLPVMTTKGATLKSVVQLEIRDVVPIDTNGLEGETCSQCGRVKYVPHTRGPFPRLLSDAPGALAKSDAYFGSGALASKAVIASSSVVAAVLANNARGVSFFPVGPLE